MMVDFRQALRGLRRTPGFTVLAVLCLSIGLGATVSADEDGTGFGLGVRFYY